jgi:hypothetical protein
MLKWASYITCAILSAAGGVFSGKTRFSRASYCRWGFRVRYSKLVDGGNESIADIIDAPLMNVLLAGGKLPPECGSKLLFNTTSSLT